MGLEKTFVFGTFSFLNNSIRTPSPNRESLVKQAKANQNKA